MGLLARLYEDILAIETPYKLLAEDGDFRPRIEYFHDAIRAYSANDHAAREPGGRLSVEILAYDLACLRFLHAMPVAPFKPHAANLSPAVEMVKLDQMLVAGAMRPDRTTKAQLADFYKHYAMLYSALLKPVADEDYRERTDALNMDVKDMAGIAAQFEAKAQGRGQEAMLAQLIGHLEDAQLRAELAAFLRQPQAKSRENIAKITAYLKQRSREKDKQIKTIEDAHMNYALAQLAIYEEARDVLKKMAQQGMNLVGSFVENSIRNTQRDMGR
jgi:hypothetical protein